MRRALTCAVAAAAVLALAVGCKSGEGTETGATGVPGASPAAPAPGVSESAASPSSAPTPSAPPTTPPAPKKLRMGDKGADVLALQTRLTELGYWIAKKDGKFGGTTQQAVYALQKAAGIGRDGTVGPKTRAALDEGVRPSAKSVAGDGYLVEINRKKQLLMLVQDGKVLTTLNTSTGSYEHYEYEGQSYLADTPAGKFKVGRQIDGTRHGPLGDLWRPKYFNGGIAVHGSPSIPPYAASHGCARLSNAAMNWIWATDKMPLRTKVWVY